MLQHRKAPLIWAINFLYPPNFTGAGLQAHREHREFLKLGMSVNVLTAGVTAAKGYRGKNNNLDGVIVHYLPVIPSPSWSFVTTSRILNKGFRYLPWLLTQLSFALWCAWELFRRSRREDVSRFETVDTFTFIPMIMARLKGIHPILRMSLFGYDDPYSIFGRAKRGKFLAYLFLISFHMAEKVVAISSAAVESCLRTKITRRKVVYIPHGVDTDLYTLVGETDRVQICRNLGLNHYKKYILFVGSAIERKGIDVLIDAFIQVHQKLESTELLIVGPNQFDMQFYDDSFILQKVVLECKEKVSAAKGDSFVHWIGEADNVNEYMSVADVFCLPSRQEGFGLVIIEAMACGLPVVVSRLEGITTDIISSPGEGIIIPGYQSKDYAEAIIGLLKNPQRSKEMGMAARSRALSVFSIQAAINQWVELFHIPINENK